MARPVFGTSKAEQQVIEIIERKSLPRRGGKTVGPYVIAHELNSEGYRTQTGKEWDGQTVKNILRRIRNQQPKPSRKKWMRKTSLKATDYLTPEQLRVCFGVCEDEREDTILRTLFGSGVRADECCGLQVKNLGIDGGKSQIDVLGKGNKLRSVFISADLCKRLNEFTKRHTGLKTPVFVNRDGKPMTYRNLYDLIKAIGKRAQIPWLHPHVTRHTYAVYLYNSKRDLFFVQEQLGHSSPETTQIYAKTLSEIKIEQLKLLDEVILGIDGGGLPTYSPTELRRQQESRAAARV